MRYILSLDRIEEEMVVLNDEDGHEFSVPVCKISGAVSEGSRIIIVTGGDECTVGKTDKEFIKSLENFDFTAYSDPSYDIEQLRKKRLERMSGLFGRGK